MQKNRLDEMEKLIILSRFNEMRGNKTHTAKSLGIGLRTLQRKLKKYGVPHGSLSIYVSGMQINGTDATQDIRD